MNKPRILLVDDSAIIRKATKQLLLLLDAETMEAADGQQAFNLAQTNRYDLIITDVNMPKMNGIDFCKRLRNNPDTQGVPVIMLSNFDSDKDIERGFEAGASLYLPKKEARERLYPAAKELLSKSAFHKERLVMVVDDSKVILNMVTRGLAQAGFQVISANDGKQALACLQKRPPDLIISDINMPKMDGFALYDAIRSGSKYASIPFMVMSSTDDRATMIKFIQKGAVGFIVKPFNINQLVIEVERLLSDQFALLHKERERLETEQKMLLASITSLVSALEARDPYTKGHSESVARILSGILALTGASKHEIKRATIGGRLHDIGKIGIRDSVLLKPDRLTEEEFAQIKQHPLIGATILKSIPSLADIVEVTLSHHERIDGNGYPAGLKGEAIPLWARIAAVADTYDALTSDRPYRKGMGREEALQIIEVVRGTQLCSECVDFFFRWIETTQ